MYAYYPHDRSHLEGGLLTFIETLGFDKNREKAVKDAVRGTLNYFYQKSFIFKEFAENRQDTLFRIAFQIGYWDIKAWLLTLKGMSWGLVYCMMDSRLIEF